MTTEPCVECGGFIGTTARGAPMSMHKRRDCPNIKRAVWPRIQVRTSRQYLASFARTFALLAGDADAYGLDAWAHTDWPREDPALITQLVTVRQQLETLLSRVVRWAHEDEVEALAAPLVADIVDLLQPNVQQIGNPQFPADLPPSVFIAPVTAPVIVLPAAVARALERLRDVTPATSALGIPQPGDAVAISQDRRRVRLWAAEFQVD